MHRKKFQKDAFYSAVLVRLISIKNIQPDYVGVKIMTTTCGIHETVANILQNKDEKILIL